MKINRNDAPDELPLFGGKFFTEGELSNRRTREEIQEEMRTGKRVRGKGRDERAGRAARSETLRSEPEEKVEEVEKKKSAKRRMGPTARGVAEILRRRQQLEKKKRRTTAKRKMQVSERARALRAELPEMLADYAETISDEELVRIAEHLEEEENETTSEELSRMAEEMELPEAIPEDEKPEYMTQFKKRKRNIEEESYNRIETAVKEFTALFRSETRELTDKEKLTEAEKRKLERELIKCAKGIVKKIEPSNVLHLFAFKSATGGWWKIGGNSVAIYSLMISSYLDRNIQINGDRDNFYMFRDGVICLQSEDRLEKDIYYSGAQMTEDKTIDFGPFSEAIKAYRLKVPFEKREVNHFKNLDPENMKKINNTIFSAAPDTEITKFAIPAIYDCFQIDKQMDGNASRVLGHPAMDAAQKVWRAYYDVANNAPKSQERYEALKLMNNYLGDMMTSVSLYAELGVSNKNGIVKTSLKLVKVRDLIRSRVNKFERKHEVAEKLNYQKNEEDEDNEEEENVENAGRGEISEQTEEI